MDRYLNQIICGDCLEVMKGLPDNSIDSIVTDPPYGLRFMGKKWDYDVPSVEQWKEALRVLKPGGHVLSFGGTRTYHRMVVNIEDAGFEIRDQIQWLYGSGFPKSLDVSKAIDKAARGCPQGSADPESPYHGQYKSGCSEDNPLGRGFGAGPGQFMKTGNPVKRMRPGADQNKDGTWKKLEDRTYRPGIYLPATPEAQQMEHGKSWKIEHTSWEGWGTALKPACEPICLARKPLNGTVANNVMAWGTGGMNIDGCRIGMEEVDREQYIAKRKSFASMEGKPSGGWKNVSPQLSPDAFIENSKLGRFPANVILDGSDEVVNRFPLTSSGKLTASQQANGGFRGAKNCYGTADCGGTGNYEENFGSAARFFYCAKASASERGEYNDHPTVKPIDLIRYLIRLITPPDGIVLDMFGGSGTTALAAIEERVKYIVIERDAHSIAIAEERIRQATRQTRMFV